MGMLHDTIMKKKNEPCLETQRGAARDAVDHLAAHLCTECTTMDASCL
jgi:hypothetical protein